MERKYTGITKNTFDRGQISVRKQPEPDHVDELKKAMDDWIAFQQSNEKSVETPEVTTEDQNKKRLLDDFALAPGVTAELKEINNSNGRHVVCIVNGIAQEMGAPLII